MTRLALAVAAYMGTVVAANTLTDRFGLVSIGLGLMVTAGTFAAGLTLIARDWVQQSTTLRWVVPAAIVTAAGISALTSTPALALASGIAFLVSEVVDWGVYTPTRDRSLPLAVLLSSVVAAPVDTVLFLWIAGFPVTVEAVAGQLVIKTGLALVVALYLRWRGR